MSEDNKNCEECGWPTIACICPEPAKEQAPDPSDAAACSLSFDPTDPEILWILGRPCFVCGPIAHILQAAGHPIKTRAEDEQAHVIVWMIRKYQEHGEGWRAKADEELSAMKKAYLAQKVEEQKQALSEANV